MSYDKIIGIRLPPKDIEGMEYCIKNGYANNQSDFVRLAVRDKVAECRRFQALADQFHAEASA